jgi:hypothetical protein
LEEAVILIEPTTSTTEILVKTADAGNQQCTVKRRQFPITPAYAFTDYHAQGQTIPYVLIDIALPPSGALSLFNVYVALSQSSGQEGIRLLQDFDDNIFKKSHDTHLLLEDDRLEILSNETKWRVEMAKQGMD